MGEKVGDDRAGGKLAAWMTRSLVAVSRYSAESSGESTWKVLARRGATLPRIRVGSAPLSRTVTLARGWTREHHADHMRHPPTMAGFGLRPQAR
jgi:hypothetical protein